MEECSINYRQEPLNLRERKNERIGSRVARLYLDATKKPMNATRNKGLK